MTENPQELASVEVMALALDDKYFPEKKIYKSLEKILGNLKQK